MPTTPIPPAPVPPKIPTGREIYDQIMAHVEPELTSANSKTLVAKYKDETPEQHEARMKRYELAFARCDKSYADYLETLDTQVSRYRHDAFAHAELVDRSTEGPILGGFDILFQKAV